MYMYLLCSKIKTLIYNVSVTFGDVGFHGDAQGSSAEDWLNFLASDLDLKTLNLAPENFLTACKARTLSVKTKFSSEKES